MSYKELVLAFVEKVKAFAKETAPLMGATSDFGVKDRHDKIDRNVTKPLLAATNKAEAFAAMGNAIHHIQTYGSEKRINEKWGKEIERIRAGEGLPAAPAPKDETVEPPPPPEPPPLSPKLQEREDERTIREDEEKAASEAKEKEKADKHEKAEAIRKKKDKGGQ